MPFDANLLDKYWSQIKEEVSKSSYSDKPRMRKTLEKSYKSLYAMIRNIESNPKLSEKFADTGETLLEDSLKNIFNKTRRAIYEEANDEINSKRGLFKTGTTALNALESAIKEFSHQLDTIMSKDKEYYYPSKQIITLEPTIEYIDTPVFKVNKDLKPIVLDKPLEKKPDETRQQAAIRTIINLKNAGKIILDTTQSLRIRNASGRSIGLYLTKTKDTIKNTESGADIVKKITDESKKVINTDKPDRSIFTPLFSAPVKSESETDSSTESELGFSLFDGGKRGGDENTIQNLKDTVYDIENIKTGHMHLRNPNIKLNESNKLLLNEIIDLLNQKIDDVKKDIKPKKKTINMAYVFIAVVLIVLIAFTIFAIASLFVPDDRSYKFWK